MTVHFIGAGPGAADLITVRGRDLIGRCPVCLYAGSIVSPELLQYCPPGARIVDTALMSLDEIEAEYLRAEADGLDVARLHSGDLSIPHRGSRVGHGPWLSGRGLDRRHSHPRNRKTLRRLFRDPGWTGCERGGHLAAEASFLVFAAVRAGGAGGLPHIHARLPDY